MAGADEAMSSHELGGMPKMTILAIGVRAVGRKAAGVRRDGMVGNCAAWRAGKTVESRACGGRRGDVTRAGSVHGHSDVLSVTRKSLVLCALEGRIM